MVGDTTTEEDLDHWAERTNDDILPAGASPFLAALLRNQGMQAVAQTEPGDFCDRKILLVCGSQSDNARHAAESLSASGAPVFETTNGSVEESAKRIANPLAQHSVTVLRHPREANYSPEELTERIAAITSSVLSFCPNNPPHLCLEGGETAAAVLQRLGETKFQVTHEWEPGVVTLVSENQLTTTVKPGSYRWSRQLLG